MFEITFDSPNAFSNPIITKDGIPVDCSQLSEAEKGQVIGLLLEKLKEVSDQAWEASLGDNL